MGAIRGNSYYQVVDGPSWTQAEDNSVALGGHLAKITESAENEWITRTISFTNYQKPGYWIGLNDVESEGTFKWTDGEVYNGWRESESETRINGWQFSRDNAYGNQDWVIINSRGAWDDAGTHENWLGEFQLKGIAEVPLTLSITRLAATKEGAGAFTTSINLSAGNSSSGNLANGVTVYWKVTGITTDDLESGALTGSGVISNGKLDVQHSLKRDSDTGESFNFSVFSDSAYTQQISTTSSVAVQEGASSNPGSVIRGNSLYQIAEGPSWTQAESNSILLGGHLTTVNDMAENEFLQKFNNGESNGATNWKWIGLNDIEAEGVFRWISGQTSNYRPQGWSPDENRGFDSPAGQDYVAIQFYGGSYSGGWDDKGNPPYHSNQGIAEIPLTLSITRSTSFKEGSDAVTSSINLSAGTSASGNLANGQTIYWKVTGITSDDLTSGSLSGLGLISNGKLDITHALKVDSDSGESFNLSVFSDSSYTQQIGSTSSASIEEALLPSSITINGNNNGIANTGNINNSGTINTGTYNSNSNNTTNNTTNNTYNNTSITYNYYTNTTNNINSNNTTNNVNSNNNLTNLNTWNIFRVDTTVKVGDIVNQWFGSSTPIAKQTQDVTDTKLLDINASSWSDKVQINRVAKATDSGDILEALMPDLKADPRVGSVLNGGAGKDVISGKAGWDVLDGGDNEDLIHGGNGRDIITGGLGRDELHGDFGWNTYKSEKDGVSDLVAIKSDQWLVNWLYGKAGNNADGSKCDIIEGLDALDKIKIIGVDTRDITFAANVNAKGLTGIGIYAKGALEALYTGNDLSINQITQMTSGDASAAAMANQINSYGVW
jgi:hypothetical protein